MAFGIFILTVIFMMSSLIFFPKIKLFKYEMNTHWIIVLVGAILVLLLGNMDYKELMDAIFTNNEMNPIKLVTFFISMTMLSIYLNEIGLFHKISFYILNKVKTSQYVIFTLYSLLAGVLTIFIGNDVVILTLTPIAIYFSKHAKINPVPYVFSVLVFANTFSITLIIGNPTNVYLALNQNISFIQYVKVMWLPSLATAITSFTLLFFIFRKDLKKEVVSPVKREIPINKIELTIGLTHMIICLVLLVLSNMISLEMWLITSISATSLILVAFVYYKVTHLYGGSLIKTVKTAPWSFIPLILGMYVMVEAIKQQGIHMHLLKFLSQFNTVFSYGIGSFLSANVMNNLPMSMFYAMIIENAPATTALKATYATIIGANLGVLLTPFGALAGLMWFDLVRKNDIEITIAYYIKNLAFVGISTLVVGLVVLELIL